MGQMGTRPSWASLPNGTKSKRAAVSELILSQGLRVVYVKRLEEQGALQTFYGGTVAA